jgi:hypothetical protein
LEVDVAGGLVEFGDIELEVCVGAEFGALEKEGTGMDVNVGREGEGLLAGVAGVGGELEAGFCAPGLAGEVDGGGGWLGGYVGIWSDGEFEGRYIKVVMSRGGYIFEQLEL